MKRIVNYLVGLLGFKLIKIDADQLPIEATDVERKIKDSVMLYTMTSQQRVWALLSATKYAISKEIQGDFVECGVWRGGSSMAMAYQLLQLGVNNRRIWLYDTFSGMTPPTDDDVEARTSISAFDLLENTKKAIGNNVWCVATKDDVSNNIAMTGYPKNMFQLIEGDVVETLQHSVPECIALLRLDTDWYESTKKELEVLFPRLVPGGVCIIDDYGHWTGSRKAVDEYFKENNINVLLHYVDRTGRMFIKL